MIATRESQFQVLRSCWEMTSHNFGVFGYFFHSSISKFLIWNNTLSDTLWHPLTPELHFIPLNIMGSMTRYWKWPEHHVQEMYVTWDENATLVLFQNEHKWINWWQKISPYLNSLHRLSVVNSNSVTFLYYSFLKAQGFRELRLFFSWEVIRQRNIMYPLPT